MELLEQSLAYELKARTELRFDPDGLRCTITLPLTTRILATDEKRQNTPSAD